MNNPATSGEFNAAIEKGVAAHGRRQFADALASYQTALELAPEDGEANSLCGLALAHLGRADEALAHLRMAVSLEPNEAGFQLNLIEGLEKAGNFEAAFKEADALTKKNPDIIRAWEKRGDAATQLPNLQNACSSYERALDLAPNNVAVAAKLAQAALLNDNSALAKDAIALGEKFAPDHPDILQQRCLFHSMSADWPALEQSAGRWAKVQPDNPAPWRSLAHAAFEQGRYRVSQDAVKVALEKGGETGELLASYGQVALHAHDFDVAQQALDQAERLDPDHAHTLQGKATLHTYLGKFEDAKNYCRRALSLDPDNAAIYTDLSRLTKGKLSAADLENLERILATKDAPLERKMPAAFAKAHHYDAVNDIEEAFSAYEAANALAADLGKRDGYTYDRAAAEKRVENIISLFNSPPEQTAQPDEYAPQPIFILGMPRSGTTLVESVIGAHSKVTTGGERVSMPQILHNVLLIGDKALQTPKALNSFADFYHADTPKSAESAHVTDKNPLNFEAIGLIATLFPNAPIIHLTRDRAETGLSIWRHEFSKYWAFATDLDDIAHFLDQHDRLMAHWRETLGDRLINITYEDFASDFENAAPALLKAAGLDVEPDCLTFQSNTSPIATFSAVQAREPVRARRGKAQAYGTRLDALR